MLVRLQMLMCFVAYFQLLSQPAKPFAVRPISQIRSAELDAGSVSRLHAVRGCAGRGVAGPYVWRLPLQASGKGAGVVTLSFSFLDFGQMLD